MRLTEPEPDTSYKVKKDWSCSVTVFG